MESPLEIETQWLREYARTYLPCDASVQFSPDLLRRSDVNLIDLISVFRNGFVVFADKIDSEGAIWIVEGEDTDGGELRIKLLVHTQEMRIRVKDVERLHHVKGPHDDAA